jgi:dihydroneopterin aldolase
VSCTSSGSRTPFYAHERRARRPAHPGGRSLQPLDLIFIDRFVGQTVIGIHDAELHRPQPVEIDLCVGVPRAAACDTDRIADTIDYSELRTRLQQLLAQHSVQLLEALAEQVAAHRAA